MEQDRRHAADDEQKDADCGQIAHHGRRVNSVILAGFSHVDFPPQKPPG